jgi:hypothetical protein
MRWRWRGEDGLTDQEDDSVQPVIAEYESNDEERNTKKHSNTSDQLDEVMDLLGYWCLSSVQARSQSSNTTHDCVVTTTYDDTSGCTCVWRQTMVNQTPPTAIPTTYTT